MIVVDGNPFDDLNALGDVWLVVHNGVVIRNDK